MGKPFFLSLQWDDQWGAQMSTEKSTHQVYRNSGPELGCGHKISKVMRFRGWFWAAAGGWGNTLCKMLPATGSCQRSPKKCLLSMKNIWAGQTLLPPPNLCLCTEMLKWVCQIYGIPVIIPPAWHTRGKANFLVISFLISYTSSKDMAKTLQQNKGKRNPVI